MKRNLLLFVLATVALGVTSFVTVTKLESQRLLAATRKPFTIQIHEKTLMVDTGQILERRSFKARRSDGSTSEGSYVELPDKSQTLTRSVTLAPERKRVLVHDLTKSVSTQFLSDKAVMRLKAGPRDPTCRSHPESMMEFHVIGEGEILGFRVVKLEARDEIGSVQELWEAPDLDCAALYEKAKFTKRAGPDPDAMWAIAEKTVTSVVAGEPAPELFEIPTGFSERPPSAVVEAAAQIETAGVLPGETKQKLSELDQAYFAAWSDHGGGQ